MPDLTKKPSILQTADDIIERDGHEGIGAAVIVTDDDAGGELRASTTFGKKQQGTAGIVASWMRDAGKSLTAFFRWTPK